MVLTVGDQQLYSNYGGTWWDCRNLKLSYNSINPSLDLYRNGGWQCIVHF